MACSHGLPKMGRLLHYYCYYYFTIIIIIFVVKILFLSILLFLFHIFHEIPWIHLKLKKSLFLSLHYMLVVNNHYLIQSFELPDAIGGRHDKGANSYSTNQLKCAHCDNNKWIPIIINKRVGGDHKEELMRRRNARAPLSLTHVCVNSLFWN